MGNATRQYTLREDTREIVKSRMKMYMNRQLALYPVCPITKKEIMQLLIEPDHLEALNLVGDLVYREHYEHAFITASELLPEGVIKVYAAPEGGRFDVPKTRYMGKSLSRAATPELVVKFKSWIEGEIQIRFEWAMAWRAFYLLDKASAECKRPFGAFKAYWPTCGALLVDTKDYNFFQKAKIEGLPLITKEQHDYIKKATVMLTRAELIPADVGDERPLPEIGLSVQEVEAVNVPGFGLVKPDELG